MSEKLPDKKGKRFTITRASSLMRKEAELVNIQSDQATIASSRSSGGPNVHIKGERGFSTLVLTIIKSFTTYGES